MLSMEIWGRIGTVDVSVSIPPVRSFVLVGPNGAGKSTILLMLLGLLRPSRGRIVVNDRLVFDSARGLDVPTEGRRISYLPQNYALFPRMTVLQNVLFGLECCCPRVERHERRDKAVSLLEELGLSHLANRLPQALSGGEAQRVALARALAPGPQALVLDEPLAALDLATRDHVRSFLACYLAKKGLPTVVVSHDPEDARWFADHIVVLENGRAVQQGTLDQLGRAPETEFVSIFAARALSEAVRSAAPARARAAGNA